jgi:zinc-binding in reverse transcriptase
MFRGITDLHADMWRLLSISLKIKVFIWLVTQNKILTRDNLMKRGWVELTQYTLCNNTEIITHLFLTCDLASQVWYWMGQCQLYYRHWYDSGGILNFRVYKDL